MTMLGLSLGLTSPQIAGIFSASPYAAYDLALDFDNADYWASGTRYTDGPEIASNSSFDTDLTNWVAESGATTWVSGSARWNNPIANQHFYQAGGIQTTKTYILTVVISAIAGTVALRLNGGNVTGSNITTVGTHTAILRDGSANGNFSLVALSSGVDVTIDSFSIKEVSYSLLPGYAFTRTGEQGAVDSDGTVDWFAANVPAINGNGYHAYGALMNFVLHSQELDNAAWVKQAGVTVTANNAVAPDGTTTADLVVGNNTTAGIYYAGGNVTPDIVWTKSVWIKAVSGTPTVVLTNPDGSGGSLNCVLTTSWQRFVLVASGSGAGLWIQNIPSSGIHVWQAQSLAVDTTVGANLPDGGPLIRTTTAAASIGASSLAVSLANGTYSATYTFDDDTTQNDPALVIADGALNLPADFAPNRNIIKQLLIP